MCLVINSSVETLQAKRKVGPYIQSVKDKKMSIKNTVPSKTLLHK